MGRQFKREAAVLFLLVLFCAAGTVPAAVKLPEAETRLTRIAFGSCAKHWQPQPIWETVIAAKPDLWLFLGDNIYADTDGATAWLVSKGQLTGEWNRLADKPEFQKARAHDQMEVGGVVRFQQRPTVLYKPLSGPKFVKSILSPPNSAALFALIQTGWPADMILQMTVQSVNGHMNAYSEYGAGYRTEVGFARFVKLIRKVQRAQALILDIKEEEGKARITLGFRTRLLDEETLRDLEEVKGLLGLDPAAGSYQIVWDVESSEPGKLAVQTRSILQVMVALAVYVETPPGDVESGRAARLDPVPEVDESGLRALLRVRTGAKEPEDAHIAVPYRDGWFWIEDTDAYSKRTFAYLQMLLSITESDEKGGAQLVITTN